jgi:hypothetical protein
VQGVAGRCYQHFCRNCVTGHYGVGVLLESCLADKLAFVERTRRLIRNTIETTHAIRLAA